MKLNLRMPGSRVLAAILISAGFFFSVLPPTATAAASAVFLIYIGARCVGHVDFPSRDNELHHFGWNACSACLCPKNLLQES